MDRTESVFARALGFVNENSAQVTEEGKKKIAECESQISTIRHALNVALSAVEKSNLPNHEKNVMKKQAVADAAAAEAELINKIHALDPQRCVSTSEKAVKFAAVAINKANEAAVQVGGTVGVVAQPVKSLFGGIKAGLNSTLAVANIAKESKLDSKPKFSI